MSSFIDKLKTQLGGYFAKEEDLAPIATTGDYNDLINAPQGGGGGSSEEKPIIIKFNFTDFINYYEQNLKPEGLVQTLMNLLESQNITQEQLYADLDEDATKEFLYASTMNIGFSLDDQRQLYLTNPLNIQLCSLNGDEECVQYPYKNITREENDENQDYICFKNDFNLNENIGFEITISDIFSIRAPIVLDTFSNNDLEETEEGYIYEMNFNQESESASDPGAGK